MGTYVIGDIHGCFTQFDELRIRIEAKDPDAVFILVGDIVARGPEDEKMLEWAYNNITPDGKYQMVLGNHDDGFIGVFGKGEFETIYSLDKRDPPTEEFTKLKDTELMYKYAVFLAKQPLVKEVEAGGQRFTIVHAWYEPEKAMSKKTPFGRRYCLLWERFLDEYEGGAKLKYKPVRGEKLIHGHTPTIFPKDATPRGYSPGKVWDMGGNVDVDCGLVYNINKKSKYGNLAAYNLETGTAEYLYDIADDYAGGEGEYLEDKLEREERERLEYKRQKKEAAKRAKPYLLAFYKQVFNLDGIPAKKDTDYKCAFNFLDDHIYPHVDTGRERGRGEFDFDYENDPLLAMVNDHGKGGKEWSDTVYFYCVKSKRWHGVVLNRDLDHHALFKFDDRSYLLSTNNYNGEFVEISVHVFNSYTRDQLLYYKAKPPRHSYDDADNIMAGDIKVDKKKHRYFYNASDDDNLEPNGLITCDFYDDYKDLFTVKVLKNHGDRIFVRVLDSQKNVLAEIHNQYRGW